MFATARVFLIAFACLACGTPRAAPAGDPWIDWRPTERLVLRTLGLAALPAPPARPDNRVADDPAAAALGKALFFDPSLSRDGNLACASCHRPAWHFTDRRARARGLGDLPRNAPSLLGVAHERFVYWDGRADSLWSQALQPLEAAAEMGSTRAALVTRVLGEPSLRRAYLAVFEPPMLEPSALPAEASPLGDARARTAWQTLDAATAHSVNRVFSNIGKAIAAYERTLAPAPSRFDRYVAALETDDTDTARELLSARELKGLRLFIDGRSGCLACHGGPRMTDSRFHNIGTGLDADGELDPGRAAGVGALLADPFNCTSRYSDARHAPAPIQTRCQHLERMQRAEVNRLMTGAFRTPSLRNLAETGPYMHDGRFETLAQVLAHYREPPDKSTHSHELPVLDLNDDELLALESFLRTLSGPIPNEVTP